MASWGGSVDYQGFDPYAQRQTGAGVMDLPRFPSLPKQNQVSGFHLDQPKPMPAATAPAASGGGSTNTAQTDPNLQKLVDKYMSRFEVDNTQRAINRSTTGIMDAAALGAADPKGNLSSRGLVGSEGGNAFLAKRVFNPAQRQAAGAAADIALGNEQRLDNLTLGGLGIMNAPGQASRADRGLALSQSGQDFDQGLQQAQLQNQMQQQQYAQWLSLLNMAGGF